MNWLVLKDFKILPQLFELWHKMPKCPNGTEQPFSQAPTASTDDRSKAIIITEVWHLSQFSPTQQNPFKVVHNFSCYVTNSENAVFLHQQTFHESTA
jgi:hypothetical protein